MPLDDNTAYLWEKQLEYVTSTSEVAQISR